MSEPHEPVFLIDASIYIFRYYFSMPAHWVSKEGYATEAVYGYGLWLLKFIQNHRSADMAACFDESLSQCFRNAIYPGYKASRVLPDDALAFQLNACKTLTQLLGVATYASSTHEADDLIATLALRCQKKQKPVCIVSKDKDLAQVIRPNDRGLWDAPDGDCLSYSGLCDKMGVKPELVADYLALMGDSSDDIPGVPGVGSKTAVALLTHMGAWSVIRNNLNAVAELPLRGAKTLAEKLRCYQSQVDMALQLSQVANNAPLMRRFSVKRSRPNFNEISHYCDELGLGKNFLTVLNRVVKSL